MSGTYWFDRERIKEMVRQGLEDGLDEVADDLASEARRRAPIRKVFKEAKGFRAKTRGLTEDEKALAITRAVRYYSDVQPDDFKKRRAVAHIRYYARVRLPSNKSANTLANSKGLRYLGVIRKGRFSSPSGAAKSRMGGYEPAPAVAAAMTSRGRYEVRSGRAIHLSASETGHSIRVQAGGALKASIENEGVRETAHGVEATVAANIRYAKYVEFPTIRTKAQPFLLPAMQDQRGKATQTVAAAIRSRLGG
jgi:HK97 gp10 family phage protein